MVLTLVLPFKSFRLFGFSSHTMMECHVISLSFPLFFFIEVNWLSSLEKDIFAFLSGPLYSSVICPLQSQTMFVFSLFFSAAQDKPNPSSPFPLSSFLSLPSHHIPFSLIKMPHQGLFFLSLVLTSLKFRPTNIFHHHNWPSCS